MRDIVIKFLQNNHFNQSDTDFDFYTNSQKSEYFIVRDVYKRQVEKRVLIQLYRVQRLSVCCFEVLYPTLFVIFGLVISFGLCQRSLSNFSAQGTNHGGLGLFGHFVVLVYEPIQDS